MPELPEVENIRAQIQHLAGARIVSSHTSELSLRYKLKAADQASLVGMHIQKSGPERLGRYILIPLVPKGMLMIHLGMTGAVRLDKKGISQKHDHVSLGLLHNGSHTYLVYNDARRFGGVSLMDATSLREAKIELRLGDEPTRLIDATRLKLLYGQSRPIKPLLMDNGLVTGIGNIYASEICHDAAISPHRLGTRLGAPDYLNLRRSMHKVIIAAIANGGSTLRNYIHVDGSKGGAQQEHRVYGREGERCSRCGTTIVTATQSGRTTFYCPCCQL